MAESTDPRGGPPRIAGMLLAAGRSSRMGEHKLLLPLGGRPVVARSAAAFDGSECEPLLVVLGREGERVYAALPPMRFAPVVNPAFASGMASSIRAGVAALLAATASEPMTGPDSVAGVVIALGDQPLLPAASMRHLLDVCRHDPGSIVAATFGGRRGHPVYFPRALFSELLSVTGDEGGRSVLASHRDLVRQVELGPEELVLDVDEPADLERARAYWLAHGSGDPSDLSPST